MTRSSFKKKKKSKMKFYNDDFRHRWPWPICAKVVPPVLKIDIKNLKSTQKLWRDLSCHHKKFSRKHFRLLLTRSDCIKKVLKYKWVIKIYLKVYCWLSLSKMWYFEKKLIHIHVLTNKSDMISLSLSPECLSL